MRYVSDTFSFCTAFEEITCIFKIMESLAHALRPLNWGLSMSGCPIIPYKRKFVNYLMNLHGVGLIIVAIIFCNFKSEVGVRGDVAHIVQVVMFVWNLQYITCSVVFILVLWKIKGQLRLFLLEISEFLDTESNQIIFRFTIGLFVSKMFIFLIIRVVFLSFYFWERFIDGFELNMKQLLLLYFQLHDWFVGTLSLYLTLLKAVHLAESNIITAATMTVLRSSPRKVYAEVLKVIEFKERVSRQISVLVCLLFVQVFMTALGTFCRFQVVYFDDQVPESSRLYSLLSLGRFGVAFIEIAFLVFMVHKWTGESRAQLESLSNTIFLSRENTVQWYPVLDIIKVAQKYKYTAFDFFDIERHLLLSFVASLVPLIVLFLQLISQGFQ